MYNDREFRPLGKRDVGYDICMVLHEEVLHDSRIWREARSLDAHGWKVVVVCIALGNSRLPSVQTMDGFTIWRVSPPIFRDRKIKTTGKLFQLAWALPAVIGRIRRAEARVYHAHDFTGLVMVAMAGIWRRPVIYDSHELFFDRTFRGLPRWIIRLLLLLRPLEKWLAQRTVAFIATSDSHAELLVENLGNPYPVIVRNTVDLRRLGDVAAAYPDDGRRLVVHSGHLLGGRHLPELVESLRYLPDDVALVLMGSGVLEARLRACADRFEVRDRLIIVPPVPPDSVAPTLAQADLAAVLITSASVSEYRSIPNKFFEAVAAGLPIVFSLIPEIKRMDDQYDLGLACDPTNPKDIAEKIEQMLQPENLTRYRENILLLRDALNWETEQEKLIAIYENIFPGLGD
jgi:glycosyltransferase involved in cell wall biosynthesis